MEIILSMGFPGASNGKESACNAGDLGSVPGLRRCPGEGKRYPLQDSGLENPMDCRGHGVVKSQTGPSDFHFHAPCSISYNNEDTEATQVPIDRWRNKEDGVYTRWNSHRHRRNEILPFAAIWKELEGILLSDISQTKKYCTHLYVESKTENKWTSKTKSRYREKSVLFLL